jgi:NhaD family Na+/H+ antiporter
MTQRWRLLPVLGVFLLVLVCLPSLAWAVLPEGWVDPSEHPLDLTQHWIGYLSVAIFVFAYVLVISEEFTHLRKSKPVVLASGIIWILIASVYAQQGLSHLIKADVHRNFLEYAELFLFLMVAMTYVNTMVERRVFDALRSWLIRKHFNYRQLFWLTGIFAFFISPIADNLTTALIMCTVVLVVGKDNSRFISLGCINIVVAANAGGAFSPFGDITTLMVWQKGIIEFWTFFNLFIPSVVNFLVPAAFMHFAVPNGAPKSDLEEVPIQMKRGAKRVIALFLMTIATAVAFHRFLHLPAAMGMVTGLGLLKFFGYYLKKTALRKEHKEESGDAEGPFDIFHNIYGVEWDTLLFFYGVMFCVGGLALIGYLGHVSEFTYIGLGATTANVMVGILSAVIDNIPIMFSVLVMQPDMSTGQWLLVTLTAGVGGSLLSIGSAAGVALMGQARGHYTFFSHLKWSPVIALGYAASIVVHMWINQSMF